VKIVNPVGEIVKRTVALLLPGASWARDETEVGVMTPRSGWWVVLGDSLGLGWSEQQANVLLLFSQLNLRSTPHERATQADPLLVARCWCRATKSDQKRAPSGVPCQKRHASGDQPVNLAAQFLMLRAQSSNFRETLAASAGALAVSGGWNPNVI
jgi:hypothetical protein